MSIQTATAGLNENIQNIIIGEMKFTAEHSHPCKGLVEKYTLPKGAKQVTVSKSGQMTATTLTDGVDLTDTQDRGVTTVDLTTGEIGLKFIVTDKQARQEVGDVFARMGRQAGDAMGKKMDTDIIALFSALNGGTVLGADNAYLKLTNVQACIAWARANKLERPISIVHHPYAMGYLTGQNMVPSATYPFPVGLSAELLKDFWHLTVDGVGIFEDGEIAKISGYDSGYGAIFSKGAMCVITSKEVNTRTQEDISLRATEVVVYSDYGVFEIDDTQGAALHYEIGALSTSN